MLYASRSEAEAVHALLVNRGAFETSLVYRRRVAYEHGDTDTHKTSPA